MAFRRIAQAGGVAAATFMIALGAPIASAHDSVIGGNVVSETPLEEFPREITLEFSAVPREGFNTFAVTDTETNEVLFDADPVVDGRDLSIDVPEDVHPGPGRYQVGFQITSSDGHATRGSVPFSVAGGAESSSTDASATDTAEAQEADPLPGAAKWIIGAGAILVVGAVLVAFWAKAHRPGSEN
ncbi:copper resistance CopC family protein [Corynebacterium sp.]|uniref:copper resistance CopC family protein n=1 Tax=Corynebacterium sp. TaxID=1720 RepID=UPI0026DC56B5|nr:copper resistance CopC family protein [Corynebacterium sp.]MDO5031732.1 copper resistance protein CopC [Corynebacterium sp.]